jgi:hypothetical protein
MYFAWSVLIMMQMRWYYWYVTDDNRISREKKKLQYRQKVDMTIRAGLNWSQEQLANTSDYQWSEWTDVPIVWEDEL